jgi:hypothetical protein
VHGRVYDDASGAGIAAASIAFRESDIGRFEGNFRSRVRVTSEKNGSFVLEGVPPGRVTLEIGAQDYAGRELDIVVSDETSPLEIGLSTGGTIAGAATWGPCSYQEGTPDMFFYGIHGIEPLFVLMGTGCETVTRIQTKDTDLVSGVWKDGRVGTYRGIRRNKADFGAVAFGSKGIVQTGKEGGYEELCREVGRFFKTGKSPVGAEETIEIFAFMEAADESKRQGGAPVSLANVLAKAKAEAAAKLAK